MSFAAHSASSTPAEPAPASLYDAQAPSGSSSGDAPYDPWSRESTGPAGADPGSGGGTGAAPEESGAIQVSQEGSAIVIVVRGHLDRDEGRSLLGVATAAVSSEDTSRLDIDLRELDSFTSEGADALVACRALGSRLADGLHYRTGRGAGRSALLAAYRAVDTGEMQAIQTEEDGGRSSSR